MSSEAPSPILFEAKEKTGIITLNRPQALNALTYPLLIKLTDQLDAWSKDPTIEAVIIKGAGTRAFCAGFDLRSIYELKQANDLVTLFEIFKTEYGLNAYINRFPKPYIAMMHGYTMGGGLGISVYGSHRIVCENTTFAMPEVTIGLFPDIGASYFLNKCPGYLGFYLALSGVHITTEDGLYAGLATHYLQQDDYDDFIAALEKKPLNVDSMLPKFQQQAKPSPFVALQPHIDRIFNQETLEDVIQALEQEKSEFSKNCLEIMASKSPTSLKVTFELMKRSRGKPLRETLEYDYLLVRKFLMGHDLFEGIRARIIDKDHTPKWQPNSLSRLDDSIIRDSFSSTGFPNLFG